MKHLFDRHDVRMSQAGERLGPQRRTDLERDPPAGPLGQERPAIGPGPEFREQSIIEELIADVRQGGHHLGESVGRAAAASVGPGTRSSRSSRMRSARIDAEAELIFVGRRRLPGPTAEAEFLERQCPYRRRCFQQLRKSAEVILEPAGIAAEPMLLQVDADHFLQHGDVKRMLVRRQEWGDVGVRVDFPGGLERFDVLLPLNPLGIRRGEVVHSR